MFASRSFQSDWRAKKIGRATAALHSINNVEAFRGLVQRSTKRMKAAIPEADSNTHANVHCTRHLSEPDKDLSEPNRIKSTQS